MIHLGRLTVDHQEGDGQYPFSVPAVRATQSLEFSSSVTFFVGENGSGRRLAAAMTLEWSHRALRGFFLRAEDFFGFTRRLAHERAEFEQRLVEFEAEYADASEFTRKLAMGPVRGSLAALERSYGADLDANLLVMLKGDGGRGWPVRHRNALTDPTGLPGRDDLVVRRAAAYGRAVR